MLLIVSQIKAVLITAWMAKSRAAHQVKLRCGPKIQFGACTSFCCQLPLNGAPCFRLGPCREYFRELTVYELIIVKFRSIIAAREQLGAR